MVWCELHGQDSRGGSKGGIKGGAGLTSLPLNFDYGEYECDFESLKMISQDELVQSLQRRVGCKQRPTTLAPPVFLKRGQREKQQTKANSVHNQCVHF